MLEQYLYRFETRLVSHVDQFDNPLPATMSVSLQRYLILKETPKGCWVERICQKPRFVLDNCRKVFANRTIAGAKLSYYARKTAYLKILDAKISNTLMGIQLVEDFQP